MLPARELVSWQACLDCPLPVNSRHTALDGTSEYSGHQTLRGVDHSPELLACDAPQQRLGAALNAIGATSTQTCILLHMLVLFVHDLRLQFRFCIQEHLALTDSTAATSLAKQL